MKVPWLFTTAAAPPVSVPPKLLARMFSPLLVLWSLNVAPLPIVNMPEPGLLLPFSWIWADVPLAVLVASSCSVRVPSPVKPVEVHAAPPRAILLPDPLCVPPDSVDSPVTVKIPEPDRRPPDWVRTPIVVVAPDNVRVPALIAIAPGSLKDPLIVIVLPLNVALAAVMLEAASSVRVPPLNWIVPVPV